MSGWLDPIRLRPLKGVPDPKHWESRNTGHIDLRGEQKEGQKKVLDALCENLGEPGSFRYTQ